MFGPVGTTADGSTGQPEPETPVATPNRPRSPAPLPLSCAENGSSRKTSCAGAPDAGSCPPSPALAGGACFAIAICAATRRGTRRATRALLLENPTIGGDGGAARHRREGR